MAYNSEVLAAPSGSALIGAYKLRPSEGLLPSGWPRFQKTRLLGPKTGKPKKKKSRRR